MEICEPVKVSSSIVLIDRDDKREYKKYADYDNSSDRSMSGRNRGYQPGFRYPFPHHGECSSAEHEPCGKVGLEDGVHPEKRISHVIFQVKEFTEEQDRKPEECEKTGKIDVFSGNNPRCQISCRDHDKCRCTISRQEKGYSNEEQPGTPQNVLHDNQDDYSKKQPIHQQEFNRVRRS